jgi:pyoverdine/dityrosine biosynthesis protein
MISAAEKLSSISDLITEAILSRWVLPESHTKNFSVPSNEVEKLAHNTLCAILSRDFRVGRFPSEEEFNQLLRHVQYWVKQGKPIQVRIGYAPVKNLNVSKHTHVDWAEFFSLCHLSQWHNKVSAVYPPGIQVRIFFDDAMMRLANHVDPQRIQSYKESFQKLVKAMGFEQLIIGSLDQSAFAWLRYFGFLQIANYRIRRWEQLPENQPKIDAMNEYARRDIIIPLGLTSEQRNQFIREASHRYRVYWETFRFGMQVIGYRRFSHVLNAMYLDGTQHHIQLKPFLHLRSLSKEQVTQPWQGYGALRDNGRGKLVPIVITSERQKKFELHTIRGLDIIQLTGFDCIDIVQEPDGGETP